MDVTTSGSPSAPARSQHTDNDTSGPDWHDLTKFAIIPLQLWYNEDTGLWNTTGWWNSANCLTTLAEYALVDLEAREGVLAVIENTFSNANSSRVVPFKVLVNGTPTTLHNHAQNDSPDQWTNGYYDDEGWWAMAFIRAFDISNDTAYLAAAASLLEDMIDGYTAPCGGIWWDKAHRGQVAIANELFLEVSAAMANRAQHLNNGEALQSRYLQWAKDSWNWFHKSGLINSDFTINDGLDAATCQNNNATVWSYNQGVILSGLVELSIAALAPSVLDFATKIATAAIGALADGNGVLHDECEPECGGDGTQFKGVFLRGLSDLQAVAPNELFTDFIARNAISIQEYNKNIAGEFSVDWSGPFVAPANASTHCSAMDALVAAARHLS